MEKELEALRARVLELEQELARPKTPISQDDLPPEFYRRYGRQMMLDGFGLSGQLKLKNASVLVIGAGGLGCPALQYLAAAGVGSIGILDDDRVDVTNLQRQILHTNNRVGWLKVHSAAAALQGINPSVNVTPFPVRINPSNAISIISSFSVVLDCSDNPATRYLVADVTSSLRIPLVSGAAMRYDGQLCTYNLGDTGPCYRCMFPKPPSPETVGTCEEVGVLGVVTGVIGTLQAMETIKIILGTHNPQTTLLIFSALSTTPFRSVKMRSRRPSCPTCGVNQLNTIHDTDYVEFCGGRPLNRYDEGKRDGPSRIRPSDLQDRLSDSNRPKINLVDVRPASEFDICRLPSSTNVPLAKLLADPLDCIDPNQDTYVICRLGNDSQVAAAALRHAFGESSPAVYDIAGGLQAWKSDIDPSFPIYW